MIHPNYYRMKTRQQRLIRRANPIDRSFENGILDRHIRPVLTADHVPIEWRFDIVRETNPLFQERLAVNAVFNAGAIYFQNEYYLMARVEGGDRKSFFAVAKSKNGFRIFLRRRSRRLDDLVPAETNVYDIRLVAHEDADLWHLLFRTQDPGAPPATPPRPWRRRCIENEGHDHLRAASRIETPSPQQRNVTLHPSSSVAAISSIRGPRTVSSRPEAAAASLWLP